MKAQDNPFRSERLERLAFREPGFSWDDLDARLAAAGSRGAIVGPEGHGKTTLLLEWRPRRQAAGWKTALIRVGRNQRRLLESQKSELVDAEAVFADSAEQLCWGGWREFVALTRAARCVVVTTHRPGRFPPVHVCRTSPDILRELVNELHGSANDCLSLWHRHRGNLRNALRELYDKAADVGRCQGPEMPAAALRR